MGGNAHMFNKWITRFALGCGLVAVVAISAGANIRILIDWSNGLPKIEIGPPDKPSTPQPYKPPTPAPPESKPVPPPMCIRCVANPGRLPDLYFPLRNDADPEATILKKIPAGKIVLSTGNEKKWFMKRQRGGSVNIMSLASRTAFVSMRSVPTRI